ncbi:MAG: transposase [Sterolibacteriaceae bacterium]|uniref:Transposase n=1 Tax=Candidatus Methylophosphatis roskildensis TaxID=2899263 RepID=A0A9D7HU35_9PROT|nr:transposase [Candidatus Methylophosphatis roskildensis]MBK6972438.1 transposase [Candidatus Methylophosphatis roskildensis]MBK6973270.1 transposase [Candidatus Methylophosphatis roskildensis]MBK7234482.1 transposase [Sterolibacteriaceae bacterium]MBK7235087.1 transposase [Sterolibacteriaceae bacterium]
MTHAFHPRRGERITAATRKKTWGDDRIMYYDARGQLVSVLTSWTSLHELDSFMAASAGRSWLRVDDLLRLSALIAALKVRDEEGGVK